MELNNIVLSGQPAVIIKCGCDFSIHGKNYSEDQVIATFTDNDVDFSYNLANVPIRNRSITLADYNEAELSQIIIKGINLNHMLNDLIFGADAANIKKPCLEIKTSDDEGKIALSNLNPLDLQVFNSDYEPIEYTNLDSGMIQVAPNIETKIYYNILLQDGASTTTMPVRLPYFKIECVSKGKLVNSSNTRESIIQIIRVNSAALSMEPFFRFNRSIDTFDLVFNVIKNTNDRIEYGLA